MSITTDSRFVDDGTTSLSTKEELLIERLVDGELSDEERELIVNRLDETVDGWRFCALSFLEAQSFREALKKSPQLGETPALSNQSPSISQRNNKRFSSDWRVRSLSAAAGFLVATVAIGGVVKFSGYSSSDLPGPASVVFHEAPTSNRSNTEPNVAIPIQKEANANSKLLADSITPQTVVLNNPAKGLSNITTPCLEIAQYDPEDLQFSNSAIPQEVVNHMYNVGGTISSHRDEYRFPLDDNRILIVPVDTYNVKSNGNQAIW